MQLARHTGSATGARAQHTATADACLHGSLSQSHGAFATARDWWRRTFTVAGCRVSHTQSTSPTPAAYRATQLDETSFGTDMTDPATTRSKYYLIASSRSRPGVPAKSAKVIIRLMGAFGTSNFFFRIWKISGLSLSQNESLQPMGTDHAVLSLPE
jgi:hypothetical protein